MMPRCADCANGNNETTLSPIFASCRGSKNNKTGGGGHTQTHSLWFSSGQTQEDAELRTAPISVFATEASLTITGTHEHFGYAKQDLHHAAVTVDPRPGPVTRDRVRTTLLTWKQDTTNQHSGPRCCIIDAAATRECFPGSRASICCQKPAAKKVSELFRSAQQKPAALNWVWWRLKWFKCCSCEGNGAFLGGAHYDGITSRSECLKNYNTSFVLKKNERYLRDFHD